MTPHIIVSVNRTHKGKLPKDTPDSEWAKYNRAFQSEALDVAGLADIVRQGYAIAANHHTNRHTSNFLSAQHVGLDFDTGNEHSTLVALSADPFVGQYAAILHTTSSHTPEAPRARALFILDQPVRDAAQYARYAAALVWWYGQSDQQCTDAARLWFGAPGCDLIVKPDNVLPLAVLDGLVAQHEAAQRAEESGQGAPLCGDPMQLLDQAIKNVAPGARHAVGFRLYCALRDIGLCLDDVIKYAQLYQVTVKDLGDHPYTWREAWASLRGAYTRRPRRRNNDELEQALVAWECSAWFDRAGLTQGAIHYSLKTLMAVSEITRKAGRTTGVDLPCRDFVAYGVPKNTAARHLKAMQKAGVLRLDTKSNYRRGNSYSLVLTETTHDRHPLDVTVTDTYRQLQDMPHFIHGARIDARLWKDEPPAGTLGPTAQRVVAALASHSHASRWDNQKKENIPSLRDCPTVTHEIIDSMSALWRKAGVSSRAGVKSFRLLVALGVCTVESSPDNYKARLPTLTDNWFERLNEIAPALTTYGHNQARAWWYEGQRTEHHRLFSNFGSENKRELSASVVENAITRRQEYDKTIALLNEQRHTWARSQGITGDIPAISLQGDPKPKQIRQPVGAHGRKIIPTNAKTGKNRKLTHERNPEAMLARYEQLADGRPLLEQESAELRRLALVLGKPITISRVALNA